MLKQPSDSLKNCMCSLFIMVIKSRKIRLARRAVRVGEMRKAYRILFGNPEGQTIYHREDLSLDVRIILKLIFECEDVSGFYFCLFGSYCVYKNETYGFHERRTLLRGLSQESVSSICLEDLHFELAPDEERLFYLYVGHCYTEVMVTISILN